MILKKFNFFFLFFVIISSTSYSQYGSIEVNSGGFSFIPIFTSDKPHFILRAGTNQEKRFNLNLLNLIMIEGMTPANYSLIARYRLIDKKLKLNVGLQLPGYRILENEELRTRNVTEVRISYPVNSKTSILFLYMYGAGKNFEMTNNFYSFYLKKNFKKIITTSQFYTLYSNLSEKNPSYGIAQAVSYEFNKKVKFNFFINKSLTDDRFNNTFGLEYSF